MNVDTDLKIEKTEYPLTGQVEFRIKMRQPVYKFNWKTFKNEVVGEKWVEHPCVEDEFEWPIWSESFTIFTDFEQVEKSLNELKNYYLRKTFKTEIL